MKITCTKKSLLQSINITQKAISPKPSMPLLEGILINAMDYNKVRLTGNNLELSIECHVDNVEVIQSGSIVINSNLFWNIVKSLPEEEVLIEEIGENIILIESGNSRFEINGMPAEGYPAPPDVEKNEAFTINQGQMREIIKRTVFAAGTDEYRPILSGCLFEYENGILTVVTIDGFRLALRRSQVEGGISRFNAIIPGKTLNEIAKILESSDDKVNIYSSTNLILFDLGKCKIVSRLLDGEYLNYRNIMPGDYETSIICDTGRFFMGIERVTRVMPAGETKYAMNINITDNEAVLTANTNLGSAKVEERVEVEGKNMSAAFNPTFFIDALRVIDEERIRVDFTSSIGPCIIKPLSGDSFIYLVLPVRK